MVVLALDTATPSPAIAVFGGDVEGEFPLPTGRQASEVLLPSLQELLSRCHLPLDRLGRVAALSGPGSFTGIRVGLATAWGLSRCLGIPLETPGSLEAVAETARGGDFYRVIASFGAERGQIYAACYDLSGSRVEELEAPHLTEPGGLAREGALVVRADTRLHPSPALAAARAIARAPREEAVALRASYVRLSAAEERRGNPES